MSNQDEFTKRQLSDAAKRFRDMLAQPFVAQCSVCKRKTIVTDQIGQTCNMTQPSGNRCKGEFKPL